METEETIVEEDFKVARRIFRKIQKELFKDVPRMMCPHMVFALCLIYARQLKHHKKEEEKL